MLKLLLDEHISRAVAEGLRRRHRQLVVFCMAEWGDERSWDSQIPPVWSRLPLKG